MQNERSKREKALGLLQPGTTESPVLNATQTPSSAHAPGSQLNTVQ
jgi:hypothetical protein